MEKAGMKHQEDVLQLEDKDFKHDHQNELSGKELAKLFRSVEEEFQRFEERRKARMMSINTNRGFHQMLVQEAGTRDPRLLIKEIIIKKDYLRYRVPPEIQGRIKHEPKLVFEAFADQLLLSVVEQIQDRLKKDIYSIEAFDRCLGILCDSYLNLLDAGNAKILKSTVNGLRKQLESKSSLLQMRRISGSIGFALEAEDKDLHRMRAQITNATSVLAQKQEDLFSSTLKDVQQVINRSLMDQKEVAVA